MWTCFWELNTDLYKLLPSLVFSGLNSFKTTCCWLSHRTSWSSWWNCSLRPYSNLRRRWNWFFICLHWLDTQTLAFTTLASSDGLYSAYKGNFIICCQARRYHRPIQVRQTRPIVKVKAEKGLFLVVSLLFNVTYISSTISTYKLRIDAPNIYPISGIFIL